MRKVLIKYLNQHFKIRFQMKNLAPVRDGVWSDIRQSQKSMGVRRRMGIYSVLLKLLHSVNLIWGIVLEKQN